MIKEAAGCAILSPCRQEVTRENPGGALGLKAVVWTVKEEANMKHMIALGVDGIISDYPNQLRKGGGCCPHP